MIRWDAIWRWRRKASTTQMRWLKAWTWTARNLHLLSIFDLRIFMLYDEASKHSSNKARESFTILKVLGQSGTLHSASYADPTASERAMQRISPPWTNLTSRVGQSWTSYQSYLIAEQDSEQTGPLFPIACSQKVLDRQDGRKVNICCQSKAWSLMKILVEYTSVCSQSWRCIHPSIFSRSAIDSKALELMCTRANSNHALITQPEHNLRRLYTWLCLCVSLMHEQHESTFSSLTEGMRMKRDLQKDNSQTIWPPQLACSVSREKCFQHDLFAETFKQSQRYL